MVNDKYLQQLKERQLEEHSDHLLTEELFSNNNNNNMIININQPKNEVKYIKENFKIKDNSKIKDNAKIKERTNQQKLKCKGNAKTVQYDDDMYYELEQKILNKYK
jgi:hypothetical protein